MSEISELVKRSKPFSTSDLVKKSGLSPRTINYLRAGHKQITLKTLTDFRKGVQSLEKAEAKKKSFKKPAKKKSPSRDSGKGSVAGKGA